MPWTTDVIVTPRMRMRCPNDSDRPTIERILTDPRVRQFLGGPVSVDVLRAFASRPVGQQSGLFVATLEVDGRTIGTFSLENERDDTELSYQLLPEFWGRGLAIEAAAALIGWGWANLTVTSIIAVTQAANERSLRLLVKLGFVHEVEFEEYGNNQTQMRLSRPDDHWPVTGGSHARILPGPPPSSDRQG
jgi:ribosomal-protein-alanine N-acetyltransferase